MREKSARTVYMGKRSQAGTKAIEVVQETEDELEGMEVEQAR